MVGSRGGSWIGNSGGNLAEFLGHSGHFFSDEISAILKFSYRSRVDARSRPALRLGSFSSTCWRPWALVRGCRRPPQARQWGGQPGR